MTIGGTEARIDVKNAVELDRQGAILFFIISELFQKRM
jgi:hypothetical protein